VVSALKVSHPPRDAGCHGDLGLARIADRDVTTHDEHVQRSSGACGCSTARKLVSLSAPPIADAREQHAVDPVRLQHGQHLEAQLHLVAGWQHGRERPVGRSLKR
jgi:hypothetical protein